jgi:hypothetical protein
MNGVSHRDTPQDGAGASSLIGSVFVETSNVDIGSTRHKRGNYHKGESQSAIIDKLTEQHASLENNSLLTAFFFLQK